MEFDILEYLGKVEDGVLVLLSFNIDNEFYDSTFYYKEGYVTLTISEQMEEHIGYVIEEHPEYSSIILSIMEKVVPYDEIIGRLDELDLSGYFENNIDNDN